jgi:hypothetical protein
MTGHMWRGDECRVAICALVLASALVAGGSGASQADVRVDDRALVQVLPADPWTDTGIRVSRGDRIAIRAWGAVVLDRLNVPRKVGPVGQPRGGNACEFLVTDTHVAPDSLVANVADAPVLDGRGFGVGGNWQGDAPFASVSQPEGRLYLGVNQDRITCDRSGYDSWALRNNSGGGFTVEVIRSRKRPR